MRESEGSGSYGSCHSKKSKVKLLTRVRVLVTPWTLGPGSLVHGIFQAQLLEWVLFSSARWRLHGTYLIQLVVGKIK